MPWLRLQLLLGFLKVTNIEIARQIFTIIEILTKRPGESNAEYLERVINTREPFGVAAQVIKIFDRINNFTTPRYSKTADQMRAYVEATDHFC